MKIDMDDILKLAKLANEGQKKDMPPPRRSRRPRNFKHLDKLPNEKLYELIQRHFNDADMINKVLKDREKAEKKEEKKEEKKWKTEHVMASLVAGYPIIALLVWLLWPKW